MPMNLRVLSLALILAGIVPTPLFAATQPDNSTEILLNGAKKWVDRDRADLAKNLLKKVLLIEPNSSQALLMLGRIELKNGKPDEAKRYLLTLEQTAPGGPQTRELRNALSGVTSFAAPGKLAMPAQAGVPLAELKAQSGRPPAARSEKHKKTNKDSLKQHIVAGQSAEKPADQTDEHSSNTALDPDIQARTDALDALADGNTELAETTLLDVLKRRPQDPEVIGGIGLVKQSQGKFEEAEKWFEQALQAAKAEKVASERWEYLIGVSKFSQYISAAKSLLEDNKLPEAEAAINQALIMKPGYPDALAVLGNIKAAANDNVEAERLYREALKTEGYNVFAARGLAALLARTKRSDEAIEFIERVLQDYPDEWKKNPYSQASLLREEANLFIEAHRPSRAMNALEKAVKVDPKNPWVRFSLAKLYISLDLAPLGRQIMQEGVALAPNDPVMHFTQALVLLSLNDYAAALDSMNQIPEESMTQDMQEARKLALIKYGIQQAENKLTQGNRKEAIRIMSIAETQARGDFTATEQVAEGWFRLGQQKQGLSAMRKLPQPVPLETQVHFASLLNRAEQDQELADYLPSLHIPEGTDDTAIKYRATIQDIEFAMAGRHYDSLMKAGKTEQAQQFADALFNANKLSSSDYFKFHRMYFSRAQLPEGAIDRLNQEKEQNPNDLDVRYDLAYAYYQDKQNGNAQREVQELLTLTKGDDVDMRLRIADLQQSLGDTTAARATIDDLVSRYPNNIDLLLRAGRMAQADGQYNRAMRYYQRVQQPGEAVSQPAVAAPPATGILLNLLPEPGLAGSGAPVATALASTGESDRIYRTALAGDTVARKPLVSIASSEAQQAMDSIRSLRSAKIETGLDMESKTASSGTSTYNAIEVPVLASFPIGYEANGFVQVDQVNINAGALSSAFNDAALFGKIQAYQYVPPQPLTPTASGTSVALGYEQGSVKADIGEVGIGFPVSNVVGGIRQSGSIGRMSYSLNLSRRPYTGTLLSYAGAKDPVTGTVWGGVTNTGLSLYMSTTLSSSSLGNFNVAAMGSYGLLRGQNVLNNDRLYLRGVIDQDIYSTGDTVLNLGLSVDYMSFAKNEFYFTFGQGGYFSPQRSLTFGLPIELDGRSDLLSYRLKAGVSYYSTSSDSSAFYPTDPALQAQAAGGALPNGYTQPVYSASTGNGFGYNLLAASEYRVTPDFVLGGRFSMERSAYYSPNSVFIYLRYLFKPETGPVKLRPDTIVPYSQYY